MALEGKWEWGYRSEMDDLALLTYFGYHSVFHTLYE